MAPTGFWDIEGEPYTTAPGSDFHWSRSRLVGGRTNHWGRIALRFCTVDFRSRSTDRMGDDWPITYDDLAPYYDKVESFIGVRDQGDVPKAATECFCRRPFLAVPKHRQEACDQLHITCIPSRLAILTKPVNGRRPCHYCGQCGRGCVSGSNFSPTR